MEKYTKTDVIDYISAKLITSDYNFNKNQIRDFMKIYEEAIYELLLEGVPVSFGCVGVFKFKTIQEQPERVSNLPAIKSLPYSPAYTKVKFNPNKNLTQEIKEKTLGKPFEV